MSDVADDALPIWFCIDCEASGPVPGLFSMLSFDVCALTEAPDGRLLCLLKTPSVANP
jgi:hypothetical protein